MLWIWSSLFIFTAHFLINVNVHLCFLNLKLIPKFQWSCYALFGSSAFSLNSFLTYFFVIVKCAILDDFLLNEILQLQLVRKLIHDITVVVEKVLSYYCESLLYCDLFSKQSFYHAEQDLLLSCALVILCEQIWLEERNLIRSSYPIPMLFNI